MTEERITADAMEMSFRTYLVVKANMMGTDVWTAQADVDATALAHPEWDMAERRTYSEWETAQEVPVKIEEGR